MKKAAAFLMASILGLSVLAGCSSGQSNTSSPSTTGESGQSASATEKTFELKLGTIRDDADPATEAVKEFARLVEEKTGGTVKVKVFNNSQLGGLADMLPGMTSGVVDMMHDRISSYGMLEGARKFNIVAAPFLWDSHEQLEGFMHSPQAQEWFEEAAQTSQVRCFMTKGEPEARELSCNKPVATAADFEGLKVRTAEIAVVQQTMKALGAEPIAIPLNDLYMALRQGTADAQENGFLTIKNKSFYEVQDYLMRTDYIRDISAYYISENIWKQMSPAQQQAMKEAAEEAGDLETQLTKETIDEALEFLKTKMTYVEIDLDSVQEKLGDEIYEQFDAEGKSWETGAYKVVKAYKESMEAPK